MAESLKRAREDYQVTPESKRQNTAPGVETVFRLLVSAKKVGSIIGKGGEIVKNIRNETNSKIRVCDPVPSCEDRVIVIAAREDDPVVEESSAQIALMRVLDRLIEAEEGQNLHHFSTRMLVCHTQAGCIIGKGGNIIKDIREVSGANIKILTENELPLCGLHNDRVVQIMGEPASLLTALKLVSRQIRDNPSKERPGGATSGLLAVIQGSSGPPAAGGPAPWGGQGPQAPGGYRQY